MFCQDAWQYISRKDAKDAKFGDIGKYFSSRSWRPFDFTQDMLLILNSEVDIALIHNPLAHPAIIAEPYRPEPLVAFVSPNHPLARNQELTVQEFERVPLIIRKPWKGRGATEQLLREMKKTGLSPNIAMRCDSPEA